MISINMHKAGHRWTLAIPHKPSHKREVVSIARKKEAVRCQVCCKEFSRQEYVALSLGGAPGHLPKKTEL